MRRLAWGSPRVLYSRCIRVVLAQGGMYLAWGPGELSVGRRHPCGCAARALAVGRSWVRVRRAAEQRAAWARGPAERRCLKDVCFDGEVWGLGPGFRKGSGSVIPRLELVTMSPEGALWIGSGQDSPEAGRAWGPW